MYAVFDPTAAKFIPANKKISSAASSKTTYLPKRERRRR